MNRNIIAPICILSVLCITLINCATNKKLTPTEKENPKETLDTQGKVDTIPVTVMEVKAQDFTEWGEYYGKVAASQEATIVCFAGGMVEEISVKEGSRVHVGQSLAKIDAQKAITALETAQLNERLAQDNYDRIKQHFQDGNASKVQVDQAHLAWLNSKSAKLEAQRIYRGALCLSPLKGTVVSRFINLHQETGPGTPTFRIAQLKKMKISIGIPEKEIAGVREGNKAEVTVDIFPGKTWSGRIARLSREVSSQKRTFNAEIIINNNDQKLKPGMTAHVKMVRRVLTNQIVVPTNLIRTSGDDSFVMLAENDTAVVCDVLIGPTNKTHSIIAQGLTSGSIIIVEGNHLVSSGTPLKIF